ncbi:hypothetical protein SPRG_09882 [Saprolegnia parasitica CBS 223.65]|uniref:Uncharacterized protein n=1 Tax=Saprolegnia parasitica (strain CBS 223.65) TaxID=695850 RepID=A0A067CCJ4_SAPPC|nr:hypothetical protein SPRG_09882 [Saprolegnia parasitica CBS 223.65]KDO24246.1 hypothetical protein SPRG_09882 [Saprolegnia parasitica CBS 223.65]|eukprot:XP_012205022.1 hypothetical protein SPRG_09882 [Saprolegnia parasitica CBS 223.65]
MLRPSSTRDLRPVTPDALSSDGPETPDPAAPRRLALRRQSSVTVPHAIKCLCSKRLVAKGADVSLCPMHAIDYMADLPMDRPKLACIPPEANIKSLPPFVVGEQVVLLGGVPSSSSSSPPKSPLKKLLGFEHWRSTVRIASDAAYCTDGTFSIQTADGSIYDGISSMRLESTTKAATDVTPRYVDKLILKLVPFSCRL